MHTEKKDLEEYFSVNLGKKVDLTITDNIRSMISFRDGIDGKIILRLHKIFYDAPVDILETIINWIQKPSTDTSELKKYMHVNKENIRKPSPGKYKRKRLFHKGKIYNLQQIFASANAEYFDSRLEMRITWGNKLVNKRVRTMRLGTYCPESGIITISRRLDSIKVPLYFLKYVVYHEMLHAFLGVRAGKNGRRNVHGKEFKILECQYRDYDKAMKFEKKFYG